MDDVTAGGEVGLEVIAPDGARRRVLLAQSPFFVGRGETGNHLAIPDARISRQCAAIVADGGRYYIEDRGYRRGVFVNGGKISRQVLKDGDVVSFGLEDSYTLVFRSAASEGSEGGSAGSSSGGGGEASSIENLLTRMGSVSAGDAAAGGLDKLNLLLEATRLLHSQLPLDAVLEAMLDRAIAITDAERGVLLEADASGATRVRLARRSGSASLATEGFSPSQTAVGLALEKQSAVITEDLHRATGLLQGAQSVLAQRLRAVVAIPLYAMLLGNSAESMMQAQRGQFLGVLYLDSRRPAAFSNVDRQILDAIAIESASILDNARLVKREREQQRVEQELEIARNIQQALLPRALRDYPHLTISGMNAQCQSVGGDYYDVFPIDKEHTAFLIADVSGKGLGAALLTTMLQGALSGMTIGADPARVFKHINDFLCEHEEVARYATMFFGTLGRDGTLEYLNAGHPSPVLLRGGEVSELYTVGSFPVGLVPEAEYAAVRVPLEPGDTLVLFSDGVTEAMDVNMKQFGVARLLGILAGQQDAPLDRLKQTILEAVEQFANGASQADDITLLLVRYRAVAGSASS